MKDDALGMVDHNNISPEPSANHDNHMLEQGVGICHVCGRAGQKCQLHSSITFLIRELEINSREAQHKINEFKIVHFCHRVFGIITDLLCKQ